MKIQENIPLRDFTTFKIGGAARFFVHVATVKELQEATDFAQKQKLPIFVLGGGSNILFSDQGFPGLVIKMEIGGITYEEEKDDTAEIEAGAGVIWDTLVDETVQRGLYGLENLSYIPGTVGAAPVQNIGAYGKEVKDTIISVEAFNYETKGIRIFTRADCHFGYRMSFFKTPEGKKYIITRVKFLLRKKADLATSYKDIHEALTNRHIIQPTLKQIRDIVVEIRTKKLPDLRHYGTAGSFFKNPIVSEAEYTKLLKNYPMMPHYEAESGKVKIPAAWILDTLCGFKGYRQGAVGVYQNQALVLVNFGDATASHVQELAQKMIKSVKDRTGLTLEREVEYI